VPVRPVAGSPDNRYFDVAHDKCFDRMARRIQVEDTVALYHTITRGDQRQKKEGSSGTLAIWLQDEIAASANSNYQD